MVAVLSTLSINLGLLYLHSWMIQSCLQGQGTWKLKVAAPGPSHENNNIFACGQRELEFRSRRVEGMQKAEKEVCAVTKHKSLGLRHNRGQTLLPGRTCVLSDAHVVSALGCSP